MASRFIVKIDTQGGWREFIGWANPGLDAPTNADMMSDMKTFTVRDLDRSPSVVLNACDRDGEARIRRRDGKTYRLVPDTEPRRVMKSLPDFAARLRGNFPKSLSAAQTYLVDQALRGE